MGPPLVRAGEREGSPTPVGVERKIRSRVKKRGFLPAGSQKKRGKKIGMPLRPTHSKRTIQMGGVPRGRPFGKGKGEKMGLGHQKFQGGRKGEMETRRARGHH